MRPISESSDSGKSETTTAEALRRALAPVLEQLGLALYDVEIVGPATPARGAGGARTLRVTIDREGGVDLDAVTEATRAISPVLDGDPSLRGPYLLEVSSPGVERALRRPEHFAGAGGSTVVVKHRGSEGPQRLHGVLVASDDTGCTVDSEGALHAVSYADISSARTVFEWGPAPRVGAGGSSRRRVKEKSRS